VKGPERRELRTLLRELEEDGLILKSSRKTYREAEALPGVMVIQVMKIDEHGDMIGVPESFKGEGNPPQVIVHEGPVSKKSKGHKAAEMSVGTRALCRKLGSGPSEHLGVLYQGVRGWRIKPVSKKTRDEYKPVRVPDGAENNDLIFFRSTRRNKGDLRLAEVTRTIGSADGGKSASLISLHENEIPLGFSDAVIKEAKKLKLPKLKGAREDLRHLPLITIDPVDAKDFDDAVLAHPDENKKNKDGWVVWVAIADVAAFVTPGSELDKAAKDKGNSVYLPDRVEPMLPHELSSDLCSLRPHEDRACMAVRMVYDKKGHKISHKFHRGLMRSHARLTYAEAQDGFMGSPGKAAEPVVDILQNLYAAYGVLKLARAEREPLAIDLPERRVHVNDAGEVTAVTVRERFDAHKLIEEFMVQANVAAAEALSKKNVTSIVRLHEAPDRDKLQGLMDFLPALDLKFTLSERVTPKRFNRLLKQAEAKDLAETVGMAVLRSQSQAVYSADGSSGHFGLNLYHYAHFTSPIRRYADLVVHRAPWSPNAMPKTAISPPIWKNILAQNLMRALQALPNSACSSHWTKRAQMASSLRVVWAKNITPTFKFGRQIRVRLQEATPVTGGLVFEMLSKGEPGKAPKRNPRGGNFKSRGAKHKRRRR